MSNETRIIVVGDAGVGKTQYIKKETEEDFEPRYIPTLCGIKTYKNKLITYFDYPGQEIYGFKNYYTFPENIDKIIYMYDCTSNLSYKNIIKKWKPIMESEYGNNVESEIIGNKIDSPDIKITTSNMISCK